MRSVWSRRDGGGRIDFSSVDEERLDQSERVGTVHDQMDQILELSVETLVPAAQASKAEEM